MSVGRGNGRVLLNLLASRGDQNGVAHAIDQHADMVYATCRRILGNDAEAADVAQETFFHFLKNSQRIRGSVAAWLHCVATGRSIDCLRQSTARRRRESVYATEVQPTEPDEWRELEPLVDEALEALPAVTRELLIEHYLERRIHVVRWRREGGHGGRYLGAFGGSWFPGSASGSTHGTGSRGCARRQRVVWVFHQRLLDHRAGWPSHSSPKQRNQFRRHQCRRFDHAARTGDFTMNRIQVITRNANEATTYDQSGLKSIRSRQTGWAASVLLAALVGVGSSNAQSLLTVHLAPPEAVASGAAWRLLGESTWRDSGVAYGNLPVGQQFLEFKPVDGWMAPASDRPVLVAEGLVTVVGALSYRLVPRYPIVVTTAGGGLVEEAAWSPAGFSALHPFGDDSPSGLNRA